ncbi:hypothetical protein ACGFOU_34325 [Streptomyces sp. NPDC048595]|uniref:hypothetical protein n=1 Tax=Streptomyces sp. NPDC048595 TaxID=3365576 RepID=UPI00371B5FF4
MRGQGAGAAGRVQTACDGAGQADCAAGESNGSRAAGAVTFSVIAAIFTRGGAAVSGTGKAATAAKAVSIAGKVGHAIDPMTYVFKGAGAGISKIGDVVAHLRIPSMPRSCPVRGGSTLAVANSPSSVMLRRLTAWSGSVTEIM